MASTLKAQITKVMDFIKAGKDAKALDLCEKILNTPKFHPEKKVRKARAPSAHNLFIKEQMLRLVQEGEIKSAQKRMQEANRLWVEKKKAEAAAAPVPATTLPAAAPAAGGAPEQAAVTEA